MTAKILDGRHVAGLMEQKIKDLVSQYLPQVGRAPGLAVILVGEDPASEIYVNNKIKACGRVGIKSFVHRLAPSTSQATLLSLIQACNEDPTVDGILVQLPLPPAMDTDNIIDAILPDKDVDGFHPQNLGLLAQRRPALRPCTPYGIMQLLEYYGLVVKGAHSVVIGASNIVGRPMSLEFLQAGFTVTTCHRFSTHLEAYVKQADILVVAVGIRNLVNPNWIKPASIVIDVGIHRLPNGKVVGDLDTAAVSRVAGWVTPVPGGVGPMTIVSLLQNTLTSYLRGRR